ncbi:MAG: glycosyltransferase, partial [Rhodobacteraceae bacterium]|nr:glycosyltransferase [Paracoccaceae bacterium]
ARTELATHLRDHPDDPQAIILRGVVAYQSGRWGRYCADLLALDGFTDRQKPKHIFETFQSFRSAQELADAVPAELRRRQTDLETPGAVCEFALHNSPEPDPAPRKGVVMMIGSLAGGGAERVVATSLRHFRETSQDEVVDLWLFSKQQNAEIDALFYLPLTGLDEKEIVLIEPAEEQSQPFVWLPRFYARKSQAIYDRLMAEKPRVVHLTLDESIVAGGIAAVLAGVPEIILHSHNMSPPNLHGNTTQSFGWDRAFRALLGRPNVRFVSVAKAALDDYLNWSGATPRDGQAMVVHNGVDFSALDDGLKGGLPHQIRRELGIPAESPVIGTALRFAEVKQPLLWVKAARLIRDAVPDAHFVMYGDGDMLEETRDHAARLDLADCLHFPGRVSDLAHRLPLFDILMLSSRSEGFPNVLIEAQAAGVVPVAFDVGGCRETMQDGRTGVIVKDLTAQALADVVIGLLDSPERLEAAKQEAMAFVRSRFSFERMAKQLRDVVLRPAQPQP